MEYNILLNSQVINEWSDTGAIDPTNAILLSLLAKYDNPHNKLEHDEDGYVWLNLAYLLDQVPWLGISERTLGRRLQSMFDAGIIDRKQVKLRTGSKLYFKMSDLYRQMEVWYNELHALESSGNLHEIEKHYQGKPQIMASESDESNQHRTQNDSAHRTQNDGAHRTQNDGAHRTNSSGNPYTINPYTKGEREKDNTSMREGNAEPEIDTGQDSLSSSKIFKDSPESSAPPEDKAGKLIARIEKKVEEDGKGLYYMFPELKKTIRKYFDRYGVKWVAQEFLEYYKSKTPVLVRRFMYEDFPVRLLKSEKNKAPPNVKFLSRPCPVCGGLVLGTIGSCGSCGFDVENFDNQEAVEEHRKWFESREKGEIETPSLFGMFEEKIRHDRTAG